MTMASSPPHPAPIFAVGIARKPSSRVSGHRPVSDRAGTFKCGYKRQAKFPNGDLVLDPSQFSILPQLQLPPKILLN